jgi:hypothetical protein
MTPTHAIIACLLSIVCTAGVAFEIGLAVGRAMPPQTAALPGNFEPTACIVGEKAARSEAAAYQALLTRAIDGCRAPVETH